MATERVTTPIKDQACQRTRQATLARSGEPVPNNMRPKSRTSKTTKVTPCAYPIRSIHEVVGRPRPVIVIATHEPRTVKPTIGTIRFTMRSQGADPRRQAETIPAEVRASTRAVRTEAITAARQSTKPGRCESPSAIRLGCPPRQGYDTEGRHEGSGGHPVVEGEEEVVGEATSVRMLPMRMWGRDVPKIAPACGVCGCSEYSHADGALRRRGSEGQPDGARDVHRLAASLVSHPLFQTQCAKPLIGQTLRFARPISLRQIGQGPVTWEEGGELLLGNDVVLGDAVLDEPVHLDAATPGRARPR